MAQVTSGIRTILSVPWIYDASQALLGAHRSRRILAREHLRASAGQHVVDVGCGTGEILAYLPDGIDYHGFDLSPDYIAGARMRYGARGRFECADITQLARDAIPPCDLAIAIGLLHHLDDDGAASLLSHLAARLAPGGRLVTVDGVWEPGQSRVARALLARDRGQNIRDAEGYLGLVPSCFASRALVIRRDLLHVPYSHAIMECVR
ncbi:methyltransferase domain-containing protein [Tolypothrix campylonemoides VB511288]|nr:methyltransferase domain-containing protein [Tolypothrix campylonemoides VB511288]